jgi:hypothetical protein
MFVAQLDQQEFAVLKSALDKSSSTARSAESQDGYRATDPGRIQPRPGSVQGLRRNGSRNHDERSAGEIA